MTENVPNVEFWFDPICPWCWMTSRWISEVAETRGFEVAWRPISLKIINEGKERNAHSDHHDAGHRAMRVIETARATVGDAAAGKLYTEIGTRIHPGARRDLDDVIAEALAAAELDPAFAAAADAEDADAQLRANTVHALEAAGPDVGVPIISIDGNAFFGPVMTPAPKGDDALRLWDALYAASTVPGFYELKRGRTVGPRFD